MNGRLVFALLLCVVHRGWSVPLLARNEPPCGAGDEFFSAGPECFNFYSCRDGALTLFECPGGSLWNDPISRCDSEENVSCSDEEPPATPEPTPSPTTTEPAPTPTTAPPSMTFLPETEGALPILFPDAECPPDIRAFQVHGTDCKLFFYCLYGILHPQTCPFLQTFNFLVGHCVEEEQRFCFPGSE